MNVGVRRPPTNGFQPARTVHGEKVDRLDDGDLRPQQIKTASRDAIFMGRVRKSPLYC